MDALSAALAQRRGKSIDPSLLGVEGQGPEQAPMDPKQVVAPPMAAPQAPLPPQASMPSPEDQALDEEFDMVSGIAGHGSKDEYEAMKGQKPRSLGERAKMGALKDLHE